jgi:hypothetical protein
MTAHTNAGAPVTKLVLRSRGALETFDLALRFIVEHRGYYLRIALLVLLPIAIVHSIIANYFGITGAVLFAGPAAALARSLLVLIGSTLVFEDKVSWRGLRKRFWESKWPIALRILGATLLSGCFALITFADTEGATITLLTLSIPIGIVAFALYYALEAALLEKATYFGAMGRSRRLMQTDSAGVAAGVFLLGGLHAAAYMLGDAGGRALITGIFMLKSPETIWQVGVTPLALLGYWGALPFIATARFLLYINTRTISEGWDIRTQFSRIAERLDAGAT